MGLKLHWVALRDTAPDEATELLELKRTGELHEGPWPEVAGAELPSGWYVAVFDGVETPRSSRLRQISAGRDVVAFQVQEDARFSSACQWSNGKELWWVLHDPEHGPDHLDARGSVPTCRAGQTRYQLPLDLASTCSGFHYDALPDGVRFEKLVQAHPKRPWWKVW